MSFPFFVIVFGLLALSLSVSASTNCHSGCDVDGGTLVDLNFTFFNWNAAGNDVSVRIKDSSGIVVANRSDTFVSNFGSSQNIKYFADYDGNYTLEFFAQGTNNDFNMRTEFQSGGSPAVFSDTNCVGTSCGGSTAIYKLNVSNSPPVYIDDNRFFPVSVKGGTRFFATVNFTQGLSFGCGANGNLCNISLAIRRLVDNNVVAIRSVDVWNNGPYQVDWLVDYDGNYVIEVFYQGGWGQYDLNIALVDTNNTYREYFDQYQNIGSTLSTGTTTQYFFNVSQSPILPFDDKKTNIPSVKGNTLLLAKINFYDGQSSGCGAGGNFCDINIGIKRLSDGHIVAAKSNENWSAGPFELNWTVDYDGNYILQVYYQGASAQYDLNLTYFDTNNTLKNFSDIYQYIGSELGTGLITEYSFDVKQSPPIIFDDKNTNIPPVKGNTLALATVTFYDGQNFGCGSFGNVCDVHINVIRSSTNEIVAYKSGEYNQGSFVLDWFADYDGEYALQVFYQGDTVEYDLNFVYVLDNGSQSVQYDRNQYIGSRLTTGSTADYNFSVINSPPVLLDDNILIPYKPKKNSQFRAKIKFYEGQSSGCGAGGNFCDVALRIRHIPDDNIVAQITSEWQNWATPATLTWTPTDDDDYYIEVFYQGAFAQYDLNVDFQDTADTNRHLEDNYQYIGSSLTTGTLTQYNVSTGPSCGNGIYCPNPTCKPILIHGNPVDKIDIVFLGSGFSDTNKLQFAVDFAIDPSNGLFSFEPFKTYANNFNVWMIDLNKTYQIGLTSGGWRFGADIQKDAKENCSSGNEFVLLSVYPRFRSYVVPDINKSNLPTGEGTHWAHVSLGCEFLGDCNYPLDYSDSDPYDPNCQGDGNSSLCSLTTDENHSDEIQSEESQRVITHEFGHSFGGLWDEYSSTQNAPYANSGGLANCDNLNSCPKWMPDVNACIPGCGYQNWYKPFNRTLMHDHLFPRVEFMTVNQNELIQDISSYETAVLPDFINNLIAYVLTFSYESGSFSLQEINLVDGYPPELLNSSNSQYSAEILSPAGDKIFDVNFSAPTALLYEPDAQWFHDGNQIFFPSQFPISNTNDVNFVMVLPYFPNGSKINIVDENNSVLLSIDTSQFTQKIESIIGYGGAAMGNSNYRLNYTLSDQPVTFISNPNYKVQLGWSVYNED